MTGRLTVAQFESSEGVEDWRSIWGGGIVGACFRTRSFDLGVTLVQEIGRLAAAANHHPDVDLRPGTVSVRLSSHDTGGVTERDVALARRISEAARALGVVAEPSEVQHLQFAIDAMDIPAVQPFWCAVLGYAPSGGEDVLDPLRRGPSLWFQQIESPRPQRNRIHVDLYLPRDQAADRIAAALEAGGVIVNEEHAPGWWTLADAEGNEVDVAIWG